MISSNPNTPMERPTRLTAQRLFILDEKLNQMRKLEGSEDLKITVSDIPEDIILKKNISIYRGEELIEMKD